MFVFKKEKKKPMGDSSLAYKYSITSCIITGFYNFYNAFCLFSFG